MAGTSELIKAADARYTDDEVFYLRVGVAVTATQRRMREDGVWLTDDALRACRTAAGVALLLAEQDAQPARRPGA
jgi:hypothetical protein